MLNWFYSEPSYLAYPVQEEFGLQAIYFPELILFRSTSLSFQSKLFPGNVSVQKFTSFSFQSELFPGTDSVQKST